jgi:hypothetical protein
VCWSFGWIVRSGCLGWDWVCVLIQHGFWFTVAYRVVWGIWSWLGIGRVAKVVFGIGLLGSSWLLELV